MSCSLIFLLTDATPFSRAIVGASAQGNLPLDHVGILDNDTQTVIEANAKEGVVETPLADFLARAPQLDGDAGYRIRNIPPEAEVDGEGAFWAMPIMCVLCPMRGLCIALNWCSEPA